MKFKFKALVASLALVAAVPASAAIATSASGNSSLILSLFDSTGAVSATFDLGFTKESFVQTADASWNLSTNVDQSAAWNSFTAAANMGTAQYAVFAGDALGSGAGAQSLFTTGAGVMARISNSTLTTALSSFDVYINANNGAASHNAVADGGSFNNASNGNAYVGVSSAYGGNAGKVGAFGSDANGLVGTNLNVWNLTSVAGNGLQLVTATQLNNAGFNPYFNLSADGVLSYVASAPVAAVPEADTTAMMLAGIGLMGFIARRRKSV
ncbi:PEP-CTERM sorting domain-containing protein [Candidatus Methylopumilus turicensis]|uniref:Ice-binding protein C-terminal domain-containing protein n=1 Tax=Candidatus Methylopumilus turicensis TaxID=1581680 RepID=A0A0B7IYW0_9PROT|nr:PEP-CTERM sorting domain-containing protein [Candidatus Methylopumilus turicensis]CEN56279.1 conserved exported protein of unknown function [Candidatus Methylopumilus turicensis]